MFMENDWIPFDDLYINVNQAWYEILDFIVYMGHLYIQFGTLKPISLGDLFWSWLVVMGIMKVFFKAYQDDPRSFFDDLGDWD